MATVSARDLAHMAQQAGYQLTSIEQLRPNRWLLMLLGPGGEDTLVMVQARPLVGAADVQDIAEIMRLRGHERAILLAHGGSFSAAALQTFAELRKAHLRLCTSLPPAQKTDTGEPRALIVPKLSR